MTPKQQRRLKAMRAKFRKPISAEDEEMLRRAAINSDCTITLPKPRIHCARSHAEFITPRQLSLMDAILTVALEPKDKH